MKIVQYEKGVTRKKAQHAISATWTKCNKEIMQLEQSATQKECKQKMQHGKVLSEKSATLKSITWQSEIWKKVPKNSAL